MNPRDGAVRLVQLIRNTDVAKELSLRSEVISCDVDFGWVASHIERTLGYPQPFPVEPVEGADAVAVLLANEHVTYEVRRIFSMEAGTDPQAAIRRLQRAAAQAPQSTRTINKTADKLMAEITARNPTSSALDFSGTAPSHSPPPEVPLGMSTGSAAAPPPGTTVVGTATGLVQRPPMPQEIPDVVGPASHAPAPAVAAPPPDVRNSQGQFVSQKALREAVDAGDMDAVRALLG